MKRCPHCRERNDWRRTRQRVYGIVWNWRHNQHIMLDKLSDLIEKIKREAEGARP
ncbi:MAG: hypothetical protein LLG20_18705 [Acidobacteriales bacterium]|nr:hypothetical protein [Terriglobales bacterium]